MYHLYKKIDADLLGSVASLICLIHCLFMPWVIMFSGAWLSQYFTHPLFHHLMLIVALLIGIPVFLRSYFKYNSKLVLFFGIIGLSLTSFGTFREEACCPHELTNSAPVLQAEQSDGCNDCDSINKSDAHCVDSEVFSLKTTPVKEESEIDFKTVPVGVAFILFAHVLNFKHRRKCKIKCCSK
jgi:hypothetical protein